MHIGCSFAQNPSVVSEPCLVSIVFDALFICPLLEIEKNFPLPDRLVESQVELDESNWGLGYSGCQTDGFLGFWLILTWDNYQNCF